MGVADRMLLIDETSIPTGDLAPVAETPFDFSKSKTVGKDIDQKNEQLTRGSGYAHTYILNIIRAPRSSSSPPFQRKPAAAS